MAKKLLDLREMLRPHLIRLGAVCTCEPLDPDSFNSVYETWEIETGAGKLEIHPSDSWAPKGKRQRFPGHIHARFTDGELGGVFKGDGPGVHNGKWNFYADNPGAEDTQSFVEYFVLRLERAMAWKPSQAELATAQEWRDAYEARWARAKTAANA